MFAFSALRDMFRIGRVLTVGVYAGLTPGFAVCVLPSFSAGFLSACGCSCEKAAMVHATVHTRSTKAANRFLTCARLTTGFKSVFSLTCGWNTLSRTPDPALDCRES